MPPVVCRLARNDPFGAVLGRHDQPDEQFRLREWDASIPEILIHYDRAETDRADRHSVNTVDIGSIYRSRSYLIDWNLLERCSQASSTFEHGLYTSNEWMYAASFPARRRALASASRIFLPAVGAAVEASTGGSAAHTSDRWSRLRHSDLGGRREVVRCAVHVRSAVPRAHRKSLRRDAADIDAASLIQLSPCVGDPS